MKRGSFSAIASVAYKEFLHIFRDRRVLVLLLILPPVFTLVFGHAFEAGEMTNVPAMLINRDGTPASQSFVDLLLKNKTFEWRVQPPTITGEEDLLGHGVQATLVIPPGWSASLANNDPMPLPLYLDGSDTNTADLLEGSTRKTLGDFQHDALVKLIDTLPEVSVALSRSATVSAALIALAAPFSV